MQNFILELKFLKFRYIFVHFFPHFMYYMEFVSFPFHIRWWWCCPNPSEG